MASAGHEPPLQLQADDSSQYLQLDGGPALGLCPGAEYLNHGCRLQAGQSLLLYTDGVTEAFAETLERFGPDRLLAKANLHRDDSPVDLVAAVAEEISHFVNQAELYDDMTMLALRCIR